MTDVYFVVAKDIPPSSTLNGNAVYTLIRLPEENAKVLQKLYNEIETKGPDTFDKITIMAGLYRITNERDAGRIRELYTKIIEAEKKMETAETFGEKIATQDLRAGAVKEALDIVSRYPAKLYYAVDDANKYKINEIVPKNMIHAMTTEQFGEKYGKKLNRELSTPKLK